MSRCRVYYQVDGKVSIDHPDQRPGKKPDGLTNDEWIDAQFLRSGQVKMRLHVDWDLEKPLLDFDEMDTSQLPNGVDPLDRKDRGRWRGSKANGIGIDNSVVLRVDIEKQLDDELAKPVPNSIAALKLQRKLDKREHD